MRPSILPQDFDYSGSVPLWSIDSGRKKISREFIFQDFAQAFKFMTLCAEYAEKIDHHPDWSNTWNRVLVQLMTHSCGGITHLDIQMAKMMDAIAKQMHPQ